VRNNPKPRCASGNQETKMADGCERVGQEVVWVLKTYSFFEKSPCVLKYSMKSFPSYDMEHLEFYYNYILFHSVSVFRIQNFIPFFTDIIQFTDFAHLS
jgi:hypothetical protein